MTTRALPDTPDGWAEAKALAADGWTINARSHGSIRLYRTSLASLAPDASGPRIQVDPDDFETAVADAAEALSTDALVAIVGTRPAAALADAGLGTLPLALGALVEAPTTLADAPGVGEKTIAKLARTAELRDARQGDS